MRWGFVAVMCAVCVCASADDTMSRGLHVSRAVQEARHAAPPDTLRGAVCDSVILSGYDKPLRASRETIFATSSLDAAVTVVGIRLRYKDMAGRVLHERTVCVRVFVAPGETRMLSIPTWDTNRSFFYHRGPRPRVSGVTPYDVEAAVVYCVTE
jgi:hypothetical protein